MGDNVQEILIDSFIGGLSDDVRAQVKNQFAASGHFDIYSNPNRLTPLRDLEEDTNGNTLEQYEIRDFWTSTVDGQLYGLGKQASLPRPKIFYKTDASAVSGSSWTLPSSSEGGATLKAGSFIQWGTTPRFYLFSGSTNISTCVPGSTFTDTAATVGETILTVAQSIISPTDNCMYMFYNNKVVRVTAGNSFSDNVVPLPTGYKITGACLWGNYIAIGMSITTINGGAFGDSLVVLWDPTLDNFSEIIPFGDGELLTFGNVEGSIVAIISAGMSSTYSVDGGKLSIRIWSGGFPQKIKEVKLNTTVSVGTTHPKCVIKDFRIHFASEISVAGTTYRGIWSFGRKAPGYPYALSLFINAEGATGGIRGLGNIGNYWFLNLTDSGAVNDTIVKTDDSNSAYFFTAFLESQKYNCGGLHKRKLLHSVFATTVPQPSGAQLVLKYRKDEESSWTTLFTEFTDNNILTELGAASGVTLPEFREIQFRLESTGFAQPTSWGFRFTELDGATTPDS